MIREADCGILLRSPHPSEIAAAVESLLGNPAEAARLGANGRRAVQERYNWGAALDRLESVYRAVLSATPGSD
jgi:glycosyltransferase involved in cell wall biosynthesis